MGDTLKTILWTDDVPERHLWTSPRSEDVILQHSLSSLHLPNVTGAEEGERVFDWTLLEERSLKVKAERHKYYSREHTHFLLEEIIPILL